MKTLVYLSSKFFGWLPTSSICDKELINQYYRAYKCWFGTVQVEVEHCKQKKNTLALKHLFYFFFNLCYTKTELFSDPG